MSGLTRRTCLGALALLALPLRLSAQARRPRAAAAIAWLHGSGYGSSRAVPPQRDTAASLPRS